MTQEPLEVRRFQQDIAQTKRKWNQAFSEREEAAIKGKEIGRKISKIISEVRKHKAERNKLNQSIKALKAERDTKNKITNDLIAKAKSLNKEKLDMASKHEVKGDPGQIKRDLDRLNMKLETEAVSFENEKKMMKLINDLKKKYAQVKEVSKVWAEMHDLNDKINDARKEAKKVHDEIQKLADESEKKHNQVIELSKQVDALKEEEAKAVEEFEAKRKAFEEIDKELNEKLGHSAEMMRKQEEFEQRKRESEQNKRQSKRDRVDAIISEKVKEVEEKISKKKKLTTQDLLAYQAKNE